MASRRPMRKRLVRRPGRWRRHFRGLRRTIARVCAVCGYFLPRGHPCPVCNEEAPPPPCLTCHGERPCEGCRHEFAE